MTACEFDRRAVLAMGAAFTVSGAHRAMAADGDFRARLAEMQHDGRVSGLHALLVSRSGRLLFEHYGEALGAVTFGPAVLHDLRSVTKSIVGMLYGIALSGGKVPPPEAKLYDQFPEYAGLVHQPGRDRITVAHVRNGTSSPFPMAVRATARRPWNCRPIATASRSIGRSWASLA